MFSKFSVKKPFTVLVMVIVILILGFVSLTSMTTDLLPEIKLPYMLVITTYPGASPERVETQVCEPMESALGTITGVKNIYSMSYENYGIVQMEFVDDTDMDSAMVKVSAALDTVEPYLPEECGIPNIMELSTDMLASVYLAVGYEGKDMQETSRFVEDVVIPYIERQDGVTRVTSIGLVEDTISVELNQEKVDALNDKILAKADDAFADALEQLEDAKKQLKDSEKKINDSRQDLVDGEKEIADNEKKLKDSQKELSDGKAELANGKDELEEAQNELNKKKNETYSMLAETSELMDKFSILQSQAQKDKLMYEASVQAALEKIKIVNPLIDKTTLEWMVNNFNPDNVDSLQTQINSLQTQIKNIDETLIIINNAYAELNHFDNDDNELLEEYEKETILGTASEILARTGNNTNDLKIATKREDAKAELEKLRSALEIQKEEKEEALNTNQVNLDMQSGLATLSGLKKQSDASNIAVSATEAELKKQGVSYTVIEKAKLEAASGFGAGDAQMAAAKAQLEAAEKQLDSAQDQIDSGWDAIADAKEQMEEGKKQLEDGVKQIKDGWDDFNDAVENYEKQKKETLRHANAEELVSINTLSALIYAQNFAMPAGYIDDQYDNSWLVKVGTSFKNLEELENIVLTNIKDIGDVKLSDVADVIQLDNADQSYARLDGENAIVLSIFKSSTSGTNEVSRNITKATEELKEQHPGLSILTMMDQGDYITMIIKGVLQSMIVGSILAIVVLALFLKDVKPTLVVAISIPLSVLTALVLMYFTNISLNMMSLGGLGLGIGMLVDNSIVVIENIYRLRSRGVSAARAAVQGTNQVLGAIVASTLTTVSVFAPMVFSTGLVRELVMPISLTISYTLLASLIIAVTVVPAAGSTMLKNTKTVEHPLFDKILNVYEKSLAYCLKVKIVPLAIAIGLLVFSIWQVLRMGIVMIPDMTSNQIEVSVEMEEEMDRATCYETADEVLEQIMAVPGIASVGAMAGGDTALFSSGSGSSNFKEYSFMIVTENPKAGKMEVKEICDAIVANTKDLPCEVTIATGMEEMSQMMGSGLSVSIYGSDLDQLREISEDLMKVVEGIEGFENISNGTEEADQVIHLTLDKDAAMRNGLTVAQIFQDLNAKISSEKTAATVTLDGVEMDIIVKDGREPLTKENLLDYTFEVSKTDDDNFNYTEDYPLGEFATIQMEDGFPNINRENQSRLMTVSATVKEGYNATLLARDLQPLLEDFEKEMPAGYTLNLGGESDSVNQMLIQMGKVIAMGLAFIYLVMVAQFQSLLSPFIVLFTVPLAFTGGLIGLLLLREPLSVMGMMGFTVLLGTVVNNGIVFVDYANQLRIGGLDRQTALIATGKTRMRPILMTALTTILAMSALLFGDDLASQMSKGMAIVVAGGLAYATLMTLFIIPVMYDILFKRKPIEVDLGSENLDDVPDDAAEYLQQQL